ncbi:DUF4190 domain-containing protein [Nocardia sp. 004]|uniref:DUF4190 domain-containing protein n=1 Tax=Nocardia sp. 004 TaxID=3385978 RepID=UPI0039A240B2
MTNPGDSDEWWKQYSGQGISPESGGQSSVPQYPSPEQPSNYPSAPQYPTQPPPMIPPQQQPQYPSYPQSASPYPQPNYGYQSPYQPYGAPARGTNGMSIAALVVSLSGFVTCGIGSIIGIILGVVALNQVKQSGEEGRGMALAGIWIGVGVIVLGILYFVLILFVGAANA